MTDLSGQTIGPYRIIERLGRGGSLGLARSRSSMGLAMAGGIVRGLPAGALERGHLACLADSGVNERAHVFAQDRLLNTPRLP